MDVFRYLLSLSLLAPISYPVSSAPTEALIEQATSGNPQAQFELAQEYQSEEKDKLAHFWYIQAAINGNNDALAGVGSLFEKPYSLDQLAIAENWYELGSQQGSQNAETGYARVLEKQFNKQREKQVSAIALLDEAADEGLSESGNLPEVPSVRHNRISTDVIIFLTLIAVVLLSTSGRRFLRNRKQTKQLNYEKLLTEKNRKIRTLQSSLNRTFEQLKKTQTQSQQQGKEQSFSLACATLGLNPSRIPDDKAIKMRYKKLCRVYHPDAGGSEEEMKRLNAAVKIVANYRSR